MSFKEIRQIQYRINSLIQRIKKLNSDIDIEVKADLSKYLCILISGYFEKSICDIINSYGDKFSPQVSRYLQLEFKWTTNIKMTKLIEIIEKFSVEWKTDFENNPSFEDWKESLDCVVSNRNNISHAADSTITLSQLEYHYLVIDEIIDFFRKYFLVYVAKK